MPVGHRTAAIRELVPLLFVQDIGRSVAFLPATWLQPVRGPGSLMEDWRGAVSSALDRP
jgi:hypothetical protein